MSNRLAIGTVQFGIDYGIANERGQVPLVEVQQILSFSKANGVNVIDTAIAYGTSEEVLGKVGVDGFAVITKLPPLQENLSHVSRWLSDQVHTSLARLGQRKLYGLLLHRPRDLVGPQGTELIKALMDIREVGLVEKIGVSIYSPDELDETFKKVKIDLVQAPLNVVDRRLQSSGWLDRLKDYGVEIHSRSTFLQGLLLLDLKKIPRKFSRWQGLWDKWHEELKAAGVSPLAASLGYPLSLEPVDRVIVGIDSAAQIEAVLRATQDGSSPLDTSFMSSPDLDLINPFNWNFL